MSILQFQKLFYSSIAFSSIFFAVPIAASASSVMNVPIFREVLPSHTYQVDPPDSGKEGYPNLVIPASARGESISVNVRKAMVEDMEAEDMSGWSTGETSCSSTSNPSSPPKDDGNDSYAENTAGKDSWYGISVGESSSEGYSDSNASPADADTSSSYSVAEGNSIARDMMAYSGKGEGMKKAPLTIVDDGGIPFTLAVSPADLDPQSEKPVRLTFSTPVSNVVGIGLTYRDPFTKTLRHKPVKSDEPIQILSKKEFLDCPAQTVRLTFVMALSDGGTREAIVDMNIH